MSFTSEDDIPLEQREALLRWCRERTASWVVPVSLPSFSQGWNDGHAFCALVHSCRPDILPKKAFQGANKSAEELLAMAFDLAEEHFGFDSYLDENERDVWKPTAVMAYVTQFYTWSKANELNSTTSTLSLTPATDATSLSPQIGRMYGDPLGTIFRLLPPRNPSYPTTQEFREARTAYRKGFDEVVKLLPHGDDASARRVAALAAVEERTAWRPLMETDPRGGYFSEAHRAEWQAALQEAVRQKEAELTALQTQTSSDGESRQGTAQALEAELTALRKQLAAVLTMTGTRKTCAGGLMAVDDDDTAKASRAAGAAMAEKAEHPFLAKLGGASGTCAVCHTKVYKMERMEAEDGSLFHRVCFACTDCRRTLKKGDWGFCNDKLYCLAHKLKAEQAEPWHRFGDPRNRFFHINKPTDPSGVLWPWEINNAKASYSHHYNNSLEAIRALASRAQAREEACRQLDAKRPWRPLPEIFTEGHHYSPKQLQEWTQQAEADLAAAQTRVDTARAAPKSAYRTRKEAKEDLKAAELVLRNCRDYLRTLHVMAGRDPDAEEAARLAALEAARIEKARVEHATLGGVKEECGVCSKRVYKLERVEIEGAPYHRLCYLCGVCKAVPKGKVPVVNGKVYCARHTGGRRSISSAEEGILAAAAVAVPPAHGSIPEDAEAPLETSTSSADGGAGSSAGSGVKLGPAVGEKGRRSTGSFGAKDWAKNSHGLDREIRNKVMDKYDWELEGKARRWLTAATGEALGEDFQLSLSDGTVLCKLINAVAPGTIKKIHVSNQSFKHRENLTSFVNACEALGVPQLDIFVTVDLYEGQNMNQVLTTLKALDRVISERYPAFPHHLGA